MSIKSGADAKVAKKSLLELSGGVGCPNFKFRPGAEVTTPFGWDFDTEINKPVEKASVLKQFPEIKNTLSTFFQNPTQTELLFKPDCAQIIKDSALQNTVKEKLITFLQESQFSSRFHRAIDKGAKPANIFAPITFDGALFSMGAGDFGNLLRLYYADNDKGWELRIAHMRKSTDVDADFLKLAKVVQDKTASGDDFACYSFSGLTAIPSGTRLGRPGDYGVTVGIHTHTELVSIGGRNKELDQLLEAQGKPVNKVYELETKAYRDYLASSLYEAKKIELTDVFSVQMLKYLKGIGYTSVGPYEAHCWDGRNGTNSIWYSSESTLNI